MKIRRTIIFNARLESHTLKTFIEIEEKYKEMLVELVKYTINRKIESHMHLRLAIIRN